MLGSVSIRHDWARYLNWLQPGGRMNAKQWTMVLWVVALINVFFGFYKLNQGRPEAAIAHFVFALILGFFAWRRGNKPA